MAAREKEEKLLIYEKYVSTHLLCVRNSLQRSKILSGKLLSYELQFVIEQLKKQVNRSKTRGLRAAAKKIVPFLLQS